MIEATMVQLLNEVIGAMVAIGMSPMPPKVIGRETYLWARGLSGLSKDLRPKRHLNILRKENSKEVRDFMKVEERGVHFKTI
jgi:hypothetical protein